ncbi:NACHT domain-containing NTPase [Desulfopila sp. IMCC35008]|uniref:NACHT domain-containing protein n=1 Tax=Desulfopila sp. IMCC35008 TaxID=2653858 RepID=UPI0013D5EAA6|nr:ATP-binding protein [Desulfopila sp. IMCC35008]
MINQNVVKTKLLEDESPILEFKREWYWDDTTPRVEKGDKWGEFIKDLISLANGYLGYVGQDRYLIIGFDEIESKFYSIDQEKINILKNLGKFKKEVKQKLENYTNPTLISFCVEFVEINETEILVFKIPCTPYLTEIKSELKTKTRTLDQGAVLVRKGQKSDSVRLANISELAKLQDEFASYKEIVLTRKPEAEPGKRKERTISKTIQQYIDKNGSYSLDIDYPKKHNDWQENIIFELFKISEPFGGVKEFLYIHESSSQGKTFGYLKSHQLVSNFDNLIILTEKPDLKDIEKRKINIKTIFKTKHVYFIDEFGYEFLYKDCFLDYEKYNLPVYVESLIDIPGFEKKSAFNVLNEWLTQKAEPLLLIKGYGGIGKTTLVKQFLDHIYDENPNTGILFIDSNEIIDELAKRVNSQHKIDDIYDFYQAQLASEKISSASFNKELLKLSVDNGSLIIVLDGIDEVIARLGSKFDIYSFLDSISNSYSADQENAKIIITCRDHFWDSLEKNSLIPEINLKPFNEELATEFFIKSFKENSSKVNKAIRYAKQFATSESSNEEPDAIYIPYVLDMIAYLIKQEGENLSATPHYKSDILSESVENDFIIASVCEREIKKLYNLSIDEQIKFFTNISVDYNGTISIYDVKQVLSTTINSPIDDQLIEKIKGHPLLTCTSNNLSFRYDFFNFYFKVLYVVQYLATQDIKSIDQSVIDIAGSYIKYNNSFTKALCERIPYSEDLELFIIEATEELKKLISSSTDGADKFRLQLSISAMFTFIICALQASTTQHFDLETRTTLMEKVFEENGVIDGLCLVNIFGHDNNKATFNFKSKVFANCLFEQFDYFWDCPLDENTRFTNSTFKSLEPRKGKKPVFFKDTFAKNCNIIGIEHILTTRSEEIENKSSEIKNELVKFFRIFYNRGNFYPKKQGHVRSKVFTSKLLPILLSENVVIDYNDPKKPTFKQYKIAADYHPIINHIEQGGACIELEKVTKMFI